MITELPNGDFAFTIGRQFFVSVYLFHLYTALSKSKDEAIKGFAMKSLKEVAYHLRHSADWVLRLGDGTEESKSRMQDAINRLWFYTDDMFDANEVDALLLDAGIAADMNAVRNNWERDVRTTLQNATLEIPSVNNAMRKGSRKGNHTEHLGYILAEMQFLPRAHPDAAW